MDKTPTNPTLTACFQGGHRAKVRRLSPAEKKEQSVALTPWHAQLKRGFCVLIDTKARSRDVSPGVFSGRFKRRNPPLSRL